MRGEDAPLISMGCLGGYELLVCDFPQGRTIGKGFCSLDLVMWDGNCYSSADSLLKRKGARVDEWNGLENRQGCKPLGGSNPPPSAIKICVGMWISRFE